ncbi:class I SAM-dependent methyltransferase [Candidatus Uhrbacteria bacterium]|nr:class I SAM-dependent methyltransferase [Candidatus Uhrbacteria bacterium]
MTNEIAKQIRDSVADFYERYGAAFGRTRGMSWNEEKMIAERVRKEMIAVDVGAGNGRFAKLLPDDIHYVGFEPSSTLRAGADPKLNLQDGSLPHLPINDATADVTVCFAVLHHLPTLDDQQAAVNELIRITKPGGLIAASAWHLSHTAPDEVSRHRETAGSEQGWDTSSGATRVDFFIPWRAEGADAKRYVHAFDQKEWLSLWTHPQIEIERIGLFGKQDWTDDPNEGRNWFVIAHKKINP